VGGGPFAGTITGGTYFDRSNNMASISGPTTVGGTFQLDFLAPAEWCTP
jgi:hypothetical protein